MVNQQHQQGIKAANEKGSQRLQLEVGDAVTSQDYWGDLKWCSRLIVKKTCPLMYQVQVAPGIIWHQHINQLRPTTVEPTDVKSAKQRWSAYHSDNLTESTAQYCWNGSRDTHGKSTGDGFCSSTCNYRFSRHDSSQPCGPWATVPQRMCKAPRRLDLWTVSIRDTTRQLDTLFWFVHFWDCNLGIVYKPGLIIFVWRCYDLLVAFLKYGNM